MPYDVFVQSTAANCLLLFVYVAYKLCNRVAASKCHYDSTNGWEIELPNANEQVTHEEALEVNDFLQKRGISFRLKNRDFPTVV